MTTDVKLLPLPQWTQYNAHLKIRANSLQRRIQGYARANMEPLIAENERLRAEVDEWKRRGEAYFQTAERQGKRAERLAEALREAQPFIGWTGSYPELHAKIDAALDQEGGNG